MNLPGNGDGLRREAAGAVTGETGAADDVRDDDVRDMAVANENGPSQQGCFPGLWEDLEVKAIIEAVLFVSQEPVSSERLVSVLGGMSKARIEAVLRSLQADYDQRGRGVRLVEVAGGFRILTRPDYAPWVKRLDKVKVAAKLSRSALETLAIIAYKQPIVRAEIEQIRGVETSSVLRTLLERKLVRMVGRKEEPGRPIMYGTTKFFLEHFGLRDLVELPPLREFKELGGPEQVRLPVEEDPLIIQGERADPLYPDQKSHIPVECETLSS